MANSTERAKKSKALKAQDMVILKVPFPRALLQGLCDAITPKFLQPGGEVFMDDVGKAVGEYLRAILVMSANAHFAMNHPVDPVGWRRNEGHDPERPAADPDSMSRELPVGLNPREAPIFEDPE